MKPKMDFKPDIGFPGFDQPNPPQDNSIMEILNARTGFKGAERTAIIPVKRDLTPEEYIKEVKSGKAGMFLDYFNAVPSRREKFKDKILPLREQMISEMGFITQGQAMQLDLFLITYFQILTIELTYSGNELILDIVKPTKKSQVTAYDYIQKHLQKLYQRLDICLDMLLKSEPNQERRLKIQAAVFGISIEGK